MLLSTTFFLVFIGKGHTRHGHTISKAFLFLNHKWRRNHKLVNVNFICLVISCGNWAVTLFNYFFFLFFFFKKKGKKIDDYKKVDPCLSFTTYEWKLGGLALDILSIFKKAFQEKPNRNFFFSFSLFLRGKRKFHMMRQTDLFYSFWFFHGTLD